MEVFLAVPHANEPVFGLIIGISISVALWSVAGVLAYLLG